jgi:hypothetical protein
VWQSVRWRRSPQRPLSKEVSLAQTNDFLGIYGGLVSMCLGMSGKRRERIASRTEQAPRGLALGDGLACETPVFPISIPFLLGRATASRAPCIRRRVLPVTTGDWQGAPRLVRARQRCARRKRDGSRFCTANTSPPGRTESPRGSLSADAKTSGLSGSGRTSATL